MESYSLSLSISAFYFDIKKGMSCALHSGKGYIAFSIEWELVLHIKIDKRVVEIVNRSEQSDRNAEGEREKAGTESESGEERVCGRVGEIKFEIQKNPFRRIQWQFGYEFPPILK